jgi:hypothetical protein
MEGAYTAMLMGEDAFKANSGFEANPIVGYQQFY